MNAYPWVLSGNGNWFAQTAVIHSGAYAARSGAIGHNQYSQMQVTVNCGTGGTMSFWYKVSSRGELRLPALLRRRRADRAVVRRGGLGPVHPHRHRRQPHLRASATTRTCSVNTGSGRRLRGRHRLPRRRRRRCPTWSSRRSWCRSSMDQPIQVVGHTYIFNEGAAPLTYSLTRVGAVAAGRPGQRHRPGRHLPGPRPSRSTAPARPRASAPRT